jgi:hypothetical protein
VGPAGRGHRPHSRSVGGCDALVATSRCRSPRPVPPGPCRGGARRRASLLPRRVRRPEAARRPAARPGAARRPRRDGQPRGGEGRGARRRLGAPPRDVLAGPALRRARPSPRARLHRHRRAHPGPRRGRQQHHLHGRQRHAAQAAAVPGAGPAGAGLENVRLGSRGPEHRVRPGLLGLAAAEPRVRQRGDLRLGGQGLQPGRDRGPRGRAGVGRPGERAVLPRAGRRARPRPRLPPRGGDPRPGPRGGDLLRALGEPLRRRPVARRPHDQDGRRGLHGRRRDAARVPVPVLERPAPGLGAGGVHPGRPVARLQQLRGHRAARARRHARAGPGRDGHDPGRASTPTRRGGRASRSCRWATTASPTFVA